MFPVWFLLNNWCVRVWRLKGGVTEQVYTPLNVTRWVGQCDTELNVQTITMSVSFDFFYKLWQFNMSASSLQLQQSQNYLWTLFRSDLIDLWNIAKLCNSLSTCCTKNNSVKKEQCSLLDSWGTLHCHRRRWRLLLAEGKDFSWM